MKYTAVSHTTPTLWDALVVLGVLALAGAIFFGFQADTSGPLTATLSVDGQVLETFILDELDGSTTYNVPDVPYEISLTIEPGRICVDHSNCPNQDCVHSGWASQAGSQLVCLPNRMLVSLTGGDTTDGVDFILH